MISSKLSALEAHFCWSIWPQLSFQKQKQNVKQNKKKIFKVVELAENLSPYFVFSEDNEIIQGRKKRKKKRGEGGVIIKVMDEEGRGD